MLKFTDTASNFPKDSEYMVDHITVKFDNGVTEQYPPKHSSDLSRPKQKCIIREFDIIVYNMYNGRNDMYVLDRGDISMFSLHGIQKEEELCKT